MKKLLIATAAMAVVAGAQAQSSVTAYGILDIGYGETKTTVSGASTAANNGTNKRTSTGNGDGGLSTSRLGFKGTEELGAGNKANFMLEYDLVDTGTGGQTFGARESWVGLESQSLGQVKLGRQATLTHGVIAGFSAGFANNTVGTMYSAGTGGQTTVSPNAATIRPHVVFADRAVAYVSPSFGGLVLGAAYGKDKSDNTIGTDALSDKSFMDLSARYTKGALDVGAAYQTTKTKATAGTGTWTVAATNAALGWADTNVLTVDAAQANLNEVETKLTTVGASYNFGIIQPFALYTEKKADGSGTTAAATGRIYKQKATEVGFRAPVTSTVGVFASAYDGDVKFDQGLDKSDLSGYQLGVTYAISKRTTAYAITGKQEIEGANGDTFKAKVTQTNVGVRHSF